jgi:hypothetical protein
MPSREDQQLCVRRWNSPEITRNIAKNHCGLVPSCRNPVAMTERPGVPGTPGLQARIEEEQYWNT